LIEGHAFGVCSFLGEKLGIPSRHIRLFFIYATFVTFYSPVIIYLILAFWINLKKWLFSRRDSVWE
jgi:phage shock protein C